MGPLFVPNLVGGEAVPAASGRTFDKLAPATGELLCRAARSEAADVAGAVAAAKRAQADWAARTPVDRGELLREIALALRERRDEAAELVAAETGKPKVLALGEADAAVEMGFFVAGEGRRLYGRTTTSAMANRTVLATRRPVGVAALIVSFNTPLPNYAWKAFPAVLCGNTAVLKPSEHTPASAAFFGELCRELLPAGVLNVLHGLGAEVGPPLVESPGVDLVSFTGSAATGRWINEHGGRRLAKVCLELGGKNALVVCDDADLDRAVEWSLASAFSNAGQRCAAGSRLIVFDAVYDRFRELLLERTRAQKVGPDDEHDFGPVINERQLENMLAAVERARAAGAAVLTGGERLPQPGFYVAPTIVEGAAPDSEISCSELFGPITTLHRVGGFQEALEVANASPYGLTAAIWTDSVHRAQEFVRRIVAGGVQVNGPTYGFEPHVPFGGQRDSGTGWREPGTEALDVYSDWKTVYVTHDPSAV
jgi:alpha-ketoglutaric semialdehyde dehydrogenase